MTKLFKHKIGIEKNKDSKMKSALIPNKLPVAIQNSINVGCAGCLVVSLKFDFAFGRLTQNTNQYKTNYRQYQTRQKFDYHTECPKVDTVFGVQEI